MEQLKMGYAGTLSEEEIDKMVDDAHEQLKTTNGDCGTVTITVRQLSILLKGVTWNTSPLPENTIDRVLVKFKSPQSNDILITIASKYDEKWRFEDETYHGFIWQLIGWREIL